MNRDWAAVRADWEGDQMTQAEIAAKHGISLATIRHHARKEGWQRPPSRRGIEVRKAANPKPARGSGGNKPAGGALPHPPRPAMPFNGRPAPLSPEQRSVAQAAFEKAQQIAALPITKPAMTKDGQPLLDAKGEPVMVVNVDILPSVLNAANVVMNREWGAPKERVETENVHRVVADRPMTIEEWTAKFGGKSLPEMPKIKAH